jgi:hypothetical protein
MGTERKDLDLLYGKVVEKLEEFDREAEACGYPGDPRGPGEIVIDCALQVFNEAGYRVVRLADKQQEMSEGVTILAGTHSIVDELR